MFFKKSLREEMQEAVLEAQRKRMQHADEEDFNRRMKEYYSDKEARLNQELNKPEEAAKSYQRPPRNEAIPHDDLTGPVYNFQK